MSSITFEQLRLIDPLLKALSEEGYTHPTPIQAQAIPPVLEQKDVLGCAQTGTGKTAAFALPLLQLLAEKKAGTGTAIKILVLTPTRELALQIGESFQAYGRYLPFKSLVIFGGVSQVPQVKELKQGVDILIATPGRLLDLMGQRHISLKDLGVFVLDEADRMLDMGFIHDVKKVVATLPAKRQTLFFSATMPAEIQHLSQSLLKNPTKVAVTPISSTAETIQQSLFYVDQKEKKKLLAHLIKTNQIDRSLVFIRTKHGADKLVKDLSKMGIHAEAIHGNKSQNARQRALSNFKAGVIQVLIATDIAARGIDIDELGHVFNYDLGDVPETYVHRIGRTGRAGNRGKAYAFCSEEEKDNLKGIEKLIGFKLPLVQAHPFLPANDTTVLFRPPKNKDVVPKAGAVIMNAPRSGRQDGPKKGKPHTGGRPKANTKPKF